MTDTPRAKKTKEEIIKEIKSLVHQPGFIYTLSLILHRDLFLDPSESADINWRERISFQEASFLAGLMIKNPMPLTMPSPDIVDNQLEKTYKLFKELHDAHIRPFLDNLSKNPTDNREGLEEEYNKLFGSGESMTEPIFYSGSGAYDFQYLEFAKKRYQNDSEWLKKNKNITIESAVKISRYLKKFSEKKARTAKKPKSFDEFYKTSLNVFCFNKEDLNDFTQDEIEAFINNFSVVPGNGNKRLEKLGDYNEIISHPIVVLEDGRYYFPVGFNLPESIYESPFYWMGKDDSYKNSALTNQGLVAEDIVFEILEEVFGKGNVYKNVLVKESKGKTITDIDVLAIAGNKAVIVQVKSKKLTELSRKGSEDNLRADFHSAVQEAYEQGLASRKAILGKENTFEHDGKKITLEEYINDAYIFCVSLNHYPAITHQTEIYLKKEKDDPYPIPISIFDLDILSFYLKDPFDFLYYMRQRIDLRDYYHASSEISLLAVHLRHKLYRRPDVDREAVDESFAQLIDANFPAMKGYEPKTKAIERLHNKWKNDQFDRLINKIKESKEPGFTDAIFFLYDLSSDSADNLIKTIEKVKIKGKSDGKQHDFTIIQNEGKSAIGYMYFPASSNKLEERLMSHAMARKYKTKADVWLSLGSIAGSKEIIDIMAFNKEPWVEDEALEEFSKIALKQGVPINISTGKKSGRNDPCPCGSGIKYKRCHGR